MRLIWSAALAVACSVVPALGQAQSARSCGERGTIVERLADRYGESRQSMGLGANNSVMEVFANTETGTWTITVSLPNGLMCLVASGQAFEALGEELEPAGMPL